jgi:hypothetical protein
LQNDLEPRSGDISSLTWPRLFSDHEFDDANVAWWFVATDGVRALLS